jgi:quinol monooxygenase YgiN
VKRDVAGIGACYAERVTTTPDESFSSQPDAPKVIVTGTVEGSETTIDELIEQSLAHVHRSRVEPGCISHGVHRDVENPLRLLFFEQWTDRAALDEHFAQPGSADFVASVRRLSSQPATLSVFDVSQRE